MLRQIIVGAFLCFTFAPSIVTQNLSEVSDGSLAGEKVPNLHFFLTNAQIEMELIIERTEKNEGFTLGRLSILKHVDDASLDGEEKEFLYDTLEPQWTEDTTGKHCSYGCGNSRTYASLQARRWRISAVVSSSVIITVRAG